MNLTRLLAIPALSKVEVSSRREIKEAQVFTQWLGGCRNQPAVLELPFWYYQCEYEGLLELRSPGGYMVRIPPDDVCDFIAAKPLLVEAMPRRTFTERAKLSPIQRVQTYGPDLFQPAQVLWVSKDRWNRVDQVYVRFVDDSHNDGAGPIPCCISDASRRTLNKVARRSRMPVAKHGATSSFSALSGSRSEYTNARRRLQHWLTNSHTALGAVPFPCDA